MALPLEQAGIPQVPEIAPEIKRPLEEFIRAFDLQFQEQKKYFEDLGKQKDQSRAPLQNFLEQHQAELEKRGVQIPQKPGETFELTPERIEIFSYIATLENPAVQGARKMLLDGIYKAPPEKRQDLISACVDEMSKQPIMDLVLIASLFQGELHEQYLLGLKGKTELSDDEKKIVFEIFFSRGVDLQSFKGKTLDEFVSATHPKFLEFLSSKGIPTSPTLEGYKALCEKLNIQARLSTEREFTAEELLRSPAMQAQLVSQLDPNGLMPGGPSIMSDMVGGVQEFRNWSASSMLTGLIRLWGVSAFILNLAPTGVKTAFHIGRLFKKITRPKLFLEELKATGKDLKDDLTNVGRLGMLGVSGLAARGALDPEYLAPRVGAVVSRVADAAKDVVGKTRAEPWKIFHHLFTEGREMFDDASVPLKEKGKKFLGFLSNRGSRAWEFTKEQWTDVSEWFKEKIPDQYLEVHHFFEYYQVAKKISDRANEHFLKSDIKTLSCTLVHFQKDQYDRFLRKILESSRSGGNKPPSEMPVRELELIGYLTTEQAKELAGKNIESIPLSPQFGNELIAQAEWLEAYSTTSFL